MRRIMRGDSRVNRMPVNESEFPSTRSLFLSC